MDLKSGLRSLQVTAEDSFSVQRNHLLQGLQTNQAENGDTLKKLVHTLHIDTS